MCERSYERANTQRARGEEQQPPAATPPPSRGARARAAAREAREGRARSGSSVSAGDRVREATTAGRRARTTERAAWRPPGRRPPSAADAGRQEHGDEQIGDHPAQGLEARRAAHEAPKAEGRQHRARGVHHLRRDSERNCRAADPVRMIVARRRGEDEDPPAPRAGPPQRGGQDRVREGRRWPRPPRESEPRCRRSPPGSSRRTPALSRGRSAPAMTVRAGAPSTNPIPASWSATWTYLIASGRPGRDTGWTAIED